MTYIIGGKQYTKSDINERCAELKELKLCEGQHYKPSVAHWADGYLKVYDPCNNWNDAGPIIDKCWDELTVNVWQDSHIYWDLLIDKHKCTKLVAACICLIELFNLDGVGGGAL
jgi:hypothetical protein